MTVSEVRRSVEPKFDELGLNIGSILDDGEFYIFCYREDVDISPIGVNKITGEIIMYFPPDHYEKFKKAREVGSTVE